MPRVQPLEEMLEAGDDGVYSDPRPHGDGLVVTLEDGRQSYWHVLDTGATSGMEELRYRVLERDVRPPSAMMVLEIVW